MIPKAKWSRFVMYKEKEFETACCEILVVKQEVCDYLKTHLMETFPNIVKE